MSELHTIESLDRQPFKYMVATIGNLPTSFVDSMSYYELLAWLCQYLEKTVIPAVNNNAEALEELQAKFIELKAYVDNYFDNLDVQEEINNKLDDMAEQGQLTDIIAQYLQLAGVLAFNTVADMQAGENLVNGSTAKTLGRLNYLDGEGRFYKIRDITNDDVVDGINIIQITADPTDTLIAELIPDNTIESISFLTPEQFGAIGDGVSDDTQAVQDCIDQAILTGTPVKAYKSYLITEPLVLNGTVSIDGGKGYDKLTETDKLTFEFTGAGYLFDTESEYDGSLFKNMRIKGDGNNNIFKNTGYRNTYDGLTIMNVVKGIDFYGDIEIWRGENLIKDCLFSDCEKSINIDDKLYADSTIKGCTFVHGDYALYGSFNAWLFADNHDYTLHGVDVVECANTQFIGNYFDKSQYMPFLKVNNSFKGGVVIANNKFLAGANISSPNALIEFVNGFQGSDLIVANNVTSGTKYATSYLLNLSGDKNVNVSLNGNLAFGITGKVINHAQYVNKNSMVSYGGYLPATSISGTANFNQVFFNNGMASIQLEVSNAGAVIGVLPFNPAASIRVPAWNASKSVMGSILLNNNGNITNKTEWLGDTILINASYTVYWNGTFGDL